MESIARFFRLPVAGDVSIDSARTLRSKSTKAADCVYILGPGHDPGIVDEFRRRAASQGLTCAVIGDGKTEVTQEMICDARSKGVIGSGAVVIAMLHGGTKRAKGGEGKTHILHTGFHSSGRTEGQGDRKKLTSTTDFIHWIRDPIPNASGTSTQSDAWRGTIHLASCHVSSFAKEFHQHAKAEKAGHDTESLWDQGNVFVYGSSKPVLNEVSLTNIDAVLRHLGDCKREGTTPEATETLRRSMVDSADTISLLGGTLTEPVVSHAPKTLLEAMPGYLQAKWMQLMAYEKLQPASPPGLSAEARGKKLKREMASAIDASPMTKDKIRLFFFTRIGHLKTGAKLDLLKKDLHSYPWLANIRKEDGTTPLMMIASRPFVYENASADACDIAKALIDSGADINAQDATGKTALHFAVREGNRSLIQMLLKAGARPDLVDKDKRTALHWACITKNHRLSSINELISTGMVPLEKRDRTGKTALHMAIASGDVKAVEALLNAGADPGARTRGWESPKDLARRARISDDATHQIITLLNNAKAAKKMPRRGGA